MERILEPEYMDTPSEAMDYDAMDHEAANHEVVTAFLAAGGGSGRIIDLGTGPGDNPILIAQACPEAKVLGVDAAATMLEIARAKAAAAGLADRIGFEQAEVKALPYQSGSFDGVFSNTILHHIPEPVMFLREAWRILRPGGVLLIRDLYRPDHVDTAWALVDKHASGASEPQRKMFFDSLHAALTLAEARDAIVRAGMTNTTVELTSDRHYTIECRRKGTE
ncbi:MAG: methyltransferase domain-containing protein [Planctomycetota bacterium]|nr:methyltransferase domain-containing protein [Planctomycetota bacterium]